MTNPNVMDDPFEFLSEEELKELDHFLLYEVECDESMLFDALDGYLHAIAIGPTTLMPRQWMPPIWGGGDAMMPPTESIEKLNRILGLIMRHFNSIISSLEEEPCEIYPQWEYHVHEGREYDDAQGWASGFTQGVKLCNDDWTPLLETPQGRAWYRPIGLLGADDYSADQDALTETLEMRTELTLQIPESVVAMYKHWLPYRQAVYEREVVKTLKVKVGRNEQCPCGSGKKFKKCCGAAADLH